MQVVGVTNAAIDTSSAPIATQETRLAFITLKLLESVNKPDRGSAFIRIRDGLQARSAKFFRIRSIYDWVIVHKVGEQSTQAQREFERVEWRQA